MILPLDRVRADEFASVRLSKASSQALWKNQLARMPATRHTARRRH